MLAKCFFFAKALPHKTWFSTFLLQTEIDWNSCRIREFLSEAQSSVLKHLVNLGTKSACRLFVVLYIFHCVIWLTNDAI